MSPLHPLRTWTRSGTPWGALEDAALKIGKRIAAAVALALLPAAPTAAQDYPSSGAVFALLDQNEWCPGGSVYLDLRTGSFMLYPRVTRPACVNHSSDLPVEQGKLEAAGLERLRAAYAKTRRAGLKRDQCDVVINNGGPQVLVITAPGFSATTPDDEGCWSDEANELYEDLFQVFGRQRQPPK